MDMANPTLKLRKRRRLRLAVATGTVVVAVLVVVLLRPLASCFAMPFPVAAVAPRFATHRCAAAARAASYW